MQTTQSAGFLTRLFYCLALIAGLMAQIVGSSGWIALTTGKSLAGPVRGTLFLLLSAALLFRVYQVIRYRHALDSSPGNGVSKLLRGLSVVAMMITGLAGLGLFFVKPLTLFLFDTAGDANIGFFVVRLYLMKIASFAWWGCAVFELSRWLGRSQRFRSQAFKWKQDGIVALAIGAAVFSLPLLRTADKARETETECLGPRIACVATVESSVDRRIALPLGSTVQLRTSVDGVRLQRPPDTTSHWHLVEGVANAIRFAGYEPSGDSAPVMLEVDAHPVDSRVVLTARVSEAGAEVARFSAKFAANARLETDSKGRRLVIAELPAGRVSATGFKTGPEDRQETVDSLFVFLREAMGTEAEVREQAQRLERTPVLVKTVQGGDYDEEPNYSARIDARCSGRVTRDISKQLYSSRSEDFGAQLSELRFPASEEVVSHAHFPDRIYCPGDAIWILHGISRDMHYRVRRFSAEGTLERYVEFELPPSRHAGEYRRVDVASLREEEGALWFDRVELDLRKDGQKVSRKLEVKVRETYRIPLGD